MRTNNFSFTVLTLLVICPAAIADNYFMQTDVFVAGEAGYKEFRIPALVVTKGGALLVICEGGITAADAGDRDLLLRRSVDGGKTWLKEIQILRDEGAVTCGNPTVIVDSQSGRIHLLSTIDAKRVFHNYSDDDGKTWSQFRDISDVFETIRKDFAWTRIATGSGLGIELTRGKHISRFVMTFWVTKDDKIFRSAVAYSDDRGQSWKISALTDPDFITNECAVYETSDGTLNLNMRGGGNHPKQERKTSRIVATSDNGGQTWSKSRFDENLIDPECHAAARRYSWPQEDKSRVLFSNPADKRGRINMTVRLSYDEGKSWPVAKQIFAGPSAYSCIERLSNGDIGLLYEGGPRHRYQKLMFARFNLEWLTDGKDKLISRKEK